MRMLIRGDRGAGKTTALINFSSETGHYILCASKKRAELVARQAREMQVKIPFPIYIGEVRRGHRRDIKVLVDDVEDVLEMMWGMEVLWATTSMDILEVKRVDTKR